MTGLPLWTLAVVDLVISDMPDSRIETVNGGVPTDANPCEGPISGAAVRLDNPSVALGDIEGRVIATAPAGGLGAVQLAGE